MGTTPGADSEPRSLVLTPEDRRLIPPSTSALMLQLVCLIRCFEQTLLALQDASGAVHGPLHSSIGEEAVAAGVCAALEPADWIASTHRGHHHVLAKAIGACLPAGFDPRRHPLPDGVQRVVDRTFAEILGFAEGYSRGRGGSMHIASREAGILGTNAIVGGGIPIATGAALAQRLSGSSAVAVAFFGDGAANQGVLFESANMAALWKLPILFVLENNHYAVATSAARSSAVTPLARKALGMGMPGLVVDGMDPDAVFSATRRARQAAAAGDGPTFIECQTYRFHHHGGSSDGTALGYRNRAEVEAWRQRDPDEIYPAALEASGRLSRDDIERLRTTARTIVECASAGAARLAAPDPRELDHGLRSSGRELEDLPYREIEDFDCLGSQKYVRSIAAVLERWLAKDPAVFILGEEVNLLGGPFGATRGLGARYPGRVLDTPISEAGFCGIALGAALVGRRPVVELMYPDFALVAADQLMNQIAKVRYMYGDQFDVPLVVRTRVGIGGGYGAQHSADPAAFFAQYPGWRIVAPSNSYDLIGLMNTAMTSEDPVLVIEHAGLYSREFPVPAETLEFAVPFGRAKVYGNGTDLLLVSYSWMACQCLEAMSELQRRGIEVTLVDLRTLDLPGLDWECLGNHTRRIGRVLICEQAPSLLSLGTAIAERLHRDCFDFLDAPIQRLAGKDVPMPVSRVLERACYPDVAAIVRAAAEFLQR